MYDKKIHLFCVYQVFRIDLPNIDNQITKLYIMLLFVFTYPVSIVWAVKMNFSLINHMIHNSQV